MKYFNLKMYQEMHFILLQTKQDFFRHPKITRDINSNNKTLYLKLSYKTTKNYYLICKNKDDFCSSYFLPSVIQI